MKTKATVTVEVHTDIPGCAEDSCSDDSPSNSPDISSTTQRNKTHKRSDQCHRFSEGDESETSV